MPIGVGLRLTVDISGSTALSPAQLFAANNLGAWYDPSDLSTMFQDSAGTTAVTAVEQPVGLILDKSKGLALGSELTTNGNFNTDTAWTKGTGWSISGGVANKTAGTASNLYQNIGSTVNKSFRISIDVVVTAGQITLSPGGYNASSAITASGTYSFIVTATAAPSDTFFYVIASAAFAGSIDNISVKQLLGNHALQATSASRPVLSSRVNLLTATAALATQSVTTVATTYRLAFSGSGSVTLSGTATGTYTAGASTFSATAGTLTLTVSGSVTSADLRAANDGVTIPAYQSVTNSTTYDTVGFPLYLRFDGTDDSLATSSIDFTSTDKVTVWAGVRKLSDAAQGVVAELSATIASNNGSFLLSAPNSAAANFNFSSKGTTQVDNTITTYTAPLTRVLTAQGDISGPLNNLRINGSAIASVTTTQGTGNYGNYPLYIGRRGGTTLPFNGRLYNLVIWGATPNAAQISAIETWVNGRTKAY